MRFGSSSEFGNVDLLGTLAVNAGVTHMAAKKADFRVGIAIKDKANPTVKSVPGYLDYRFLGGLASAVVAGTVGRRNAMVSRVGHDVASGLLNSFVATETMRNACMQAGDSASAPQGAASQNVLGMADDELAGEHAVSGNYAYGW
mgnify:CR=1 FL=1|jgi:hypothetical protein